MPAASLKTIIYTADTSVLEESPALFDALYSSVSESRRNKADRMRTLKDKCLSLGAEYLLMCACRDFGIDYRSAEIVCDGRSKPVFRDLDVCFNLSHSHRRAMCIISELQAGCDVEQVHAVNPEIAKRFFSGDEYAALENCACDSEREDLFFTLWTLKESFMKCTGLGLSLPLDAFSVSPGSEGISLRQSVDRHSYTLFSRSPGDGYKYAWCLRDYEKGGETCNEPDVRQKHFDIFG